MAKPVKLLVVEDDAVTRRAVVRAIKKGEDHVEVSEEADGRLAVEMILRGQFDCVLLDYQLPQIDGLTVLRQAREAGCRTPIIIMTARGDEQLAVEMMKAGASDYLSKSLLSSERLWQGLRNAMRIHTAETALRESEARLRLALVAGGLRIWDWDVNRDVFAYDNDSAQLMPQTGPLTLAKVIDRIHPDDQERVRQSIQKSLTTLEEFSSEFRIRRAGDLYRCTNSRGRVYRDSDGRAVRLLGVSIDIDERRQAEQGLRDAEERYRALFEHSPYGVMILDPIGRRIIDFNNAAHRQLGYPRHYFATLWLDDLAAK